MLAPLGKEVAAAGPASQILRQMQHLGQSLLLWPCSRHMICTCLVICQQIETESPGNIHHGLCLACMRFTCQRRFLGRSCSYLASPSLRLTPLQRSCNADTDECGQVRAAAEEYHAEFGAKEAAIAALTAEADSTKGHMQAEIEKLRTDMEVSGQISAPACHPHPPPPLLRSHIVLSLLANSMGHSDSKQGSSLPIIT